MKWDPEYKMVTSLLDLKRYFRGLNLRVNWIWSSYLDHCPALSLRGKETTQKNCQSLLPPNPHSWTLLPHYIRLPVLDWFSPRALSECPPDVLWTYTDTCHHPWPCLSHLTLCLPPTPGFNLIPSPFPVWLHSFIYWSNTYGMLNTRKLKAQPSWRRYTLNKPWWWMVV